MSPTKAWVGTAFALATALSAHPALAQKVGDLLVTPTRLTLDDVGRSGSITVVNKGTQTVRYRLNVVDMTMSPDGILQRTPSGTPNSAAGYLRLSPREIVLEPGASQRIKVLAMIGPEQPDGEWRSHLSFEPILRTEAPQESQSGVLKLSIETRAVVTMPVIVTHGRVAATASLSEARVAKEGSDWVARFKIGREGNRTIRGDVSVNFVPQGGGQPVPLGKIASMPVYFPNPDRSVRLAIATDVAKLGKGTIEFTFLETDRARGAATAKIVVPAPG